MRVKRTVKLPAVVTNVASYAGGGVMSPHNRGVDAHIDALATARKMQTVAAATAVAVGRDLRPAGLGLRSVMMQALEYKSGATLRRVENAFLMRWRRRRRRKGGGMRGQGSQDSQEAVPR